MQPAYYEDFDEIKKKIWSMLDDAVTRSKEQVEDDAIRNTSIPLEYEDIIKKIHSDKE